MKTPAATKILFLCDGGPAVGGGHVLRCLTLALALSERGLTPVFAAPPYVAAILDRFAPVDLERVAVAADRLPELRAEALGAGAVVFDHYGLDAQAQSAVAGALPVLVIDDLADRPLVCDLLLDPSPGRTPEAYAGRVPPGATLLLGPRFALVRRAFAALRASALQRRVAPPAELSVLVSLGLTDVGGITGRLVERLQPRLGPARLDVVLGAEAPSLARVERLAARDPRVRLQVDVQDMAALIAQADLVVGAGGSSTWERAVLGAPTLLVVLADNQAEAARVLNASRAVEAVDARAPTFEADFDRAFTGLMRSPDRRARLSQASAALCDGEGAGRVADALLALLARA